MRTLMVSKVVRNLISEWTNFFSRTSVKAAISSQKPLVLPSGVLGGEGVTFRLIPTACPEAEPFAPVTSKKQKGVAALP